MLSQKIKSSNKNRSSKTLFVRGQSSDDSCVTFKCQNVTSGLTDTIRLIREPPVFRLSPPPNPLKFFNLNEIFYNNEISEYSKERFLLYFLNYQHSEDLKEKCNSLRIQLLADDELDSKNLIQKTGSRIIDYYDSTSKKTFSISRNTTKLNNLATTTNIMNNSFSKNQLPNSNLNESSNFFNFFNIVLFSFTIFLLIGLILLVVYLVFIKKKSNYKKKNVLSTDSTYLSNNNNQKLLSNHQNLVINDLNNQCLNEQYQHLLDTSHAYNYMNDVPQVIPSNFFYNSTQNYVIKNLKNENVLFKTLNPNCSTSSTSSSSSNPNTSSTASSALTNSMPLNYNSFKQKNSKKNKKVDTLNRKCSCVSSASTSSNCSNSSSILIKPTANQPESFITLMRQKNDYSTSQHNQNISEFCINPYQPIIMDLNTGATISPYNIIDTNTLNKVALICSQDQQFNTPKLVKIVNLPNYCTSCVHHVQQVSINSQNYAESDQHYVNNFNDERQDTSEQVYEIIDVENDNEEMRNLSKGFNQKSDVSSLRKKYPRTNPNYLSINKI